jgi:hypothetical protein
MQLYGQGLLMTFTEVPPELEDDFNEWYNREHLDERINIPGFRRARRYAGIDAEIKYFTTYEALASDNIASPDYLDVLQDQTEWSRRIMPQFSKWHRMPCRVVADHTHGMGAALCLMRLFPDPAKADELAAWLNGGALEELNKAPGIVGSCAASVDIDADGRLAGAFGQTLDPDQNGEWAILVEGNEPEQTTATARDHLSERLAATALPGTELVVEKYRFMYGNLRTGDDVIA